MKKIILLLTIVLASYSAFTQPKAKPADTVFSNATKFVSKQHINTMLEALKDMQITQRQYEFIHQQLREYLNDTLIKADSISFINIQQLNQTLEVLKDMPATPRQYQVVLQVFINMTSSAISDWEKKKKLLTKTKQ